MERASWQRLVAQGASADLRTRTLACFNANVDVVAHLEPTIVATMHSAVLDQVGPLPPIDPDAVEIRSVQEFLALLKESLKAGKSTYAVLEDLSALGWFDTYFTNAQRAVGGQAGIIGNQMASLGAESTVYTPNFGQAQAELLHAGVKVPVVRDDTLHIVPRDEAVQPGAVEKVNWIFEYAADIEFAFGDEIVRTPRANRVIVATRPPGLEMSFCGSVSGHLAELAASVDVAYMAGYHYASPDNFAEYMAKVAAQLSELRAGNDNLKMHYEYVPTKYSQIEATLLTTICSHVDSLGINEHEIVRALDLFDFEAERAAIEADENAFTLYKGALALLRRLNVSRIHVHNLGYYVIVLQKDYTARPQIVRDAALFGSTVNAAKAKYGGIVSAEQVRTMHDRALSDIGFSHLAGFAEHPNVVDTLRPADLGIWEGDDHWVLVVPAHIVPDPVSTVGMGDTVSSSSYSREVEWSAVASPQSQ